MFLGSFVVLNLLHTSSRSTLTPLPPPSCLEQHQPVMSWLFNPDGQHPPRAEEDNEPKVGCNGLSRGARDCSAELNLL